MSRATVGHVTRFDYEAKIAKRLGTCVEGKEMSACENSLRWLIDKWLAPTSTMPVRITRFSRTRMNHGRYVRVEAMRDGEPFEIFFFRHNDGSWRVFPPAIERPTLRTVCPSPSQAAA